MRGWKLDFVACWGWKLVLFEGWGKSIVDSFQISHYFKHFDGPEAVLQKIGASVES
jgi:hypothetical protein